MQQLLDEVLDSESTPEEVCRSFPELLPEVRTRWHEMCHAGAELGALFPTAGLDPGAGPADQQQGSYWDHILLDADSRLIVTRVIGRRDTDTARQAFADFYRRTDGDLTPLITSGDYAAYFTVITAAYGVRQEELGLTEEQKVGYDYEGMPEVYFPVGMAYATVHKGRERGHVVRVEQRGVLGAEGQAG